MFTVYQLLESKNCKCMNGGYEYYHIEHTAKKCEQIVNEIIVMIDKGEEITEKFVDMFFEFITHKLQKYYNKTYKCIIQNKGTVCTGIEKLATVTKIKEKYLKMMLPYAVYDRSFVILSENNEMEYSAAFLEYMIDTRLRHSCDEIKEYLVDAIIKTNNSKECSLTENILKELAGCRNTYLQMKIANVIDKYNGKIDKTLLTRACKALPYSKPLVISLVGRGLKINSKCLEVVCEYCDMASIQFILAKSKTEVKKNHYDAVVRSKKYVKERKRYDNASGKYQEGGYSKQKMELLINNGYEPTYTDIMNAVRYRAEIPEIDRFGIKGDDELLELCQQNNFYPKYNFKSVSNEMIELQELCQKRAKVQIARKIKQTKLKPDKKCMENACKYRSNLPVIEILLENGGEVTFECIENCLAHISTNSMLPYLVKEFKKNYAVIEKTELERLRASIKETNAELNKNKKEAVSTLKLKQASKNSYELSEECSYETDRLESKIPNNDGASEHDILELNEKEIDEMMGIKKIKKKETILDMDKYDMKNKPKNKRKVEQIPKLYAEYFKLNKTEKKSFITMKKEILTKIREKKWYNKEKTLIDIPKDMRKKLKIGNGYIKMGDVDKLLVLFY